MDGAPSYLASSTMDLLAGGGLPPVTFARQEADFGAPNKVYLKQVAVSVNGTQATSEVITIAATGYVSATDTVPPHTWNRINPAEVGADPSALNIAALLGLMQYATNIQPLGDE